MKSKKRANLNVSIFIFVLLISSVFATNVGVENSYPNENLVEEGTTNPVLDEGSQTEETEKVLIAIEELEEIDSIEESGLIEMKENSSEIKDAENEPETASPLIQSDGYYYIELNESSEGLFELVSNEISLSDGNTSQNDSDPEDVEIFAADLSVSTNQKLLMSGENLSFAISSNLNEKVIINIKDVNGNAIHTGEVIGNNTIYQFNTSNLAGGKYSVNLTLVNSTDSSILTSVSKDFSIARVNFDVVKIGERGVKATMNISSGENINNLFLGYGDGSTPEILNNAPGTLNNNYYHNYSFNGNFSLDLKVIFDNRGEMFNFQKKVTVNVVNTPVTDETDPVITLIYPSNNEVINDDSVTFSYNVTDNVLVSNCTLNLYNETLGGYMKMNNISNKVTNVGKSKEYNVSYSDFDNGKYLWEVECSDNSSNSDDVQKYFSINVTTVQLFSNVDYERKADVEAIISGINEFLEKKNDYDIGVQEVLEDLGITKDMDFYKRRILQIQQDLKDNFKFVTDATLKEKTKSDMFAEIDEMKKNVVTDIRIIDEKEFMKTRVDLDFEKFVQDYIESNEIKMRASAIRNLVEYNEEIQSNINVETSFKSLEIKRLNVTDRITVVSKIINNKAGDSNLFEVFPEKISSEAMFETKGNVKNNYFSFTNEDLLNKKLVYYFESEKSFDELEEIETVLFEEKVPEGRAGITGLSIFDLSSDNTLYYGVFGLLILVLIGIGIVVFKRMKINRWKEEPNVLRMFDLLSQSKNLLRYKDLEGAREKYHKIKEIYPLLPLDSKGFFFEKIREIQVEIDKTDIFNLVKEYEQAKREFRKEDGQRLYLQIQDVYKRLPKKYREVVYNKVFKY